jgi:hypothetical protein
MTDDIEKDIGTAIADALLKRKVVLHDDVIADAATAALHVVHEHVGKAVKEINGLPFQIDVPL